IGTFLRGYNSRNIANLGEALSRPDKFLGQATTGALKWVYVSPAFTVGGAAWSGAFAKLEKGIDNMIGVGGGRLGRYNSPGEIPWLLQKDANGKPIGRLTADAVMRSAIEGPRSGVWMA